LFSLVVFDVEQASSDASQQHPFAFENAHSSCLNFNMEIKQTESNNFRIHFLETFTRLFFSLEIIVLLVVMIIVLVVKEVNYAALLEAFYGGLIIAFLWSIVVLSMNIKFAQIWVNASGISGFTIWGKRKFVQFTSIESVKTRNILLIKSLRISSANAIIWIPIYLAEPNQFCSAVEKVAGSENPLYVALRELGIPNSRLESEMSVSNPKRKWIAILFGLLLILISAGVWIFGVINIYFFIEENVVFGDIVDSCSQVANIFAAWINFFWSTALIIGAMIPALMIWKNYDRKRVIVATVLSLSQNIFSFLFGILFLFAACL